MSDFAYTVERAEAAVSVDEYLARCVDAPRFLECCKQCPNYDGRWSCPPFDFEPMELWGKYKKMRLYARFLIPGDNRDGAALITALEREKSGFVDELLALERKSPGSLALACGACKICPSCTRGAGLPCRHPDKMRPSIESLGGDVGETALRYFGRPLLWVRDGVAPDYLMLVGGLLLGEEQA